MTLEQISILANIVSAFAVVVTLLFLIQQIRQNTKALRAQSMNAANEVFTSVNLQVASTPEQARIYMQCIMDFEQAPPDMQVQFSFTCMSVFRVFESIYLQVQMDVADPRLWEGEKKSVRSLARMPGIQQWWRANTFSFSNEFCDLMDRYIEEENNKKPALN